MLTRRFDLIVFDWDGTLFDSTRLIARCIQAACADVGTAVPSDRDASYVIGLGLGDALRHAAPDVPRERYRELADRYRHHYLASQDEIVLFDGTLEMLLALKARNHWLASLPARRGAASIRRSRGSPLARPVRRHPHRRRDARQARSADACRADARARRGARRTLMVGDTTHDLQLAANAGCASVAVSFGAHEHDEFASHRPLHVAHSTADLARLARANG